MLADLDDRLGESIQRGRGQAGSIAGPLILGDRVQEETVLVTIADLSRLAPLQRDHISQARFEDRLAAGALVTGGGCLDEGQQGTPGIDHGTGDYMSFSWNPGDSGKFL
jgi:hypothetical protein